METLDEKFDGIIPFRKDTAEYWPEEGLYNPQEMAPNVSIMYQLCTILNAYAMKSW